MTKLFVGNLSFRTTEDELMQVFSQHGAVDAVSVITDRTTGQSRGFGFVEMPNREEAENAITALNGADLNGRTLNVNEARPKSESPRGGGGGYGGGGGGNRGGGGGYGGGGGGKKQRW